MRHPSLGPAGGLSTVLAILSLATIVPVAGQAPSTPAKASGAAARSYVPPKTPDGQPDLQGFWTNATYTPLQRPKNVTKEYYTLEEVIAKEKAEAANDASGWTNGPENKTAIPGTEDDLHYDRYQWGLARSQSTVARNLRTSLITDPPDGRLPALTAEGQKRLAERGEYLTRRGGLFDAAETNEHDERCINTSHAGPPILQAGYNSNYQIVQSPESVMILTEQLHIARIIPLDGYHQLPKTVLQWTGSSRGRWDGNTLVVETSNINPDRYITPVGGAGNFPPLMASSENMRVTERFTRVAADRIQYRFTVEDTATWTRPWSAEVPLQKSEGKGPIIFEHACHEGNYGLRGQLSGARAEEKRAAEAAARAKQGGSK